MFIVSSHLTDGTIQSWSWPGTGDGTKTVGTHSIVGELPNARFRTPQGVFLKITQNASRTHQDAQNANKIHEMFVFLNITIK